MRLIFAYLIFLGFTAAAQPAVPENHFIVIAHRGDHTHAPENTLKAFENAVRLGVDLVEVDLRTTRDGELIIMHDETVDRMTDGKGKVNDLTWAQLERLRVTEKNHPEWGSFPIPTFRDVLGWCRGKVNIYLDFKNAPVAAAWQAITAEHMEKEVTVYINSEKQYHEWRRNAPDVPLIISAPKNLKDAKALSSFLEDVDAEILDGSYEDYTYEKVNAAHLAGRKVWADIQHPAENPTLWEAALQLKPDGLQTDHPGELIAYLREKNLR